MALLGHQALFWAPAPAGTALTWACLPGTDWLRGVGGGETQGGWGSMSWGEVGGRARAGGAAVGCGGREPCAGLPGQPPSLRLCLQSPGPEDLPSSGEGSRENLLHQAMQNSGIVLERVAGEEGALEPAPPTASSPQPLGDGPPELPLLEVEQVETVGACAAGVLLGGGGRWQLTLGRESPR